MSDIEAARPGSGTTGAELELQKLNRSLRAISDCNQALIGAVDELDLLNQVCHIVIEVCGYKLAWVGYVVHDAKKSVRPVAQVGFEDGYLDCIKVTWDDSDTGRGPTGTAIRTRKPSISRDFLTDPHFAPWRDQAIKRGYASSIVEPLIIDSEVIGALNVYSARPDAFHSDEMLLLSELANFLAYGISAMRVREQQKQAEYALRQSEERLRSLGDNLPDSYVYQYTYNQDGSLRILYLSAGVERLHGVNAEDAMCDTSLLSRQINEEQVPDFIAAELVSRETMADYEIELEMLHSDGSLHWLQLRSHPRRAADGSIEWDGVATDITRRKQADAEKQAAEEEKERLGLQLLQAQKMESVGRLAGGVAHDFNNMLGVILGHTEMAMENLDPSDPLYEDLDEIHLAADRSAELTRHLLAFARKQTVVPVVLDLNNTVSGMLKMLRRLIGEDITLAWHPKLDLWPIKVDPSQIDQIMANLCVNARDAISDVGKITLDTGNRSFDDEFCSMNPDFQVGDYVRLSVSDSGCGIDSDTLTHIFEPFFTTKNLGQGTGLGLSTVYGCVSQSNGFIHVYSELGRGTTFSIYLPRHMGSNEPTGRESETVQAVHGNETILLVEDDNSILRLVVKMLQHLGYHVLTANSPNDAIQIAAEHPNKISILLTDVVMPDMNGFDLARYLRDLYPQMKCLFMSGYTADVIANRGIVYEDVHLVQKPFTMIELASMLRAVLSPV